MLLVYVRFFEHPHVNKYTFCDPCFIDQLNNYSNN